MPYNPGTGIYTLPAIYLAVPGTTIIAAQHNQPLEDLEVANNYARPIVAGGTGQATAALARGSTGLSTAGNIGLKGANIASAATLALVAEFNYFHVTGSVAITAISARAIGERILLEFEASTILTYHATNLILIGNANLKVAAGTVMEFVYEGASSWRQVAMVSRPPTQTLITVSGTVWTRPPGCLFAEFEGVGGGGGSGGINGTGSGSGATGGGGSGFYGTTGVLDVSAVVSAVVTIGAAGTAGDLSTDGGNGGNTAITIGATTYTWGGGTGSTFLNVGADGQPMGGIGGVGTNVVGTAQQGNNGTYNHAALDARSGQGGGNPLGTGGLAIRRISIGGNNGTAGVGRGAGAGGAINVTHNSDQTGAAGTAGYMRITEYYG